MDGWLPGGSTVQQTVPAGHSVKTCAAVNVCQSRIGRFQLDREIELKKSHKRIISGEERRND